MVDFPTDFTLVRKRGLFDDFLYCRFFPFIENNEGFTGIYVTASMET
jgi:hypothetical protein